jgi:hypothetical protein
VQTRNSAGTSELAQQHREDGAAIDELPRTQGVEEVRRLAATDGSLRQLAQASGVHERELLVLGATELVEMCTRHAVDVGAVMGEWGQRKETAAVAAASGTACASTWAQRIFRRIDRHNDCWLRLEELEYALEWLGDNTRWQLAAKDVMDQLDVDHDGKVDESEWVAQMGSCKGLEDALRAGEERDKMQHMVHAGTTQPNAKFQKAEVWLDFELRDPPAGEDAPVQGVLRTDGTVTHARIEGAKKIPMEVELQANRMIREVENDDVNLICVFGGTRSGKSTIMSILAGKELFETSDQGDSFTMGIHVGNHFMKLQDFCGLYGGRSPKDPESRQPLVTQDGSYPLVGFVDAEGQVSVP